MKEQRLPETESRSSEDYIDEIMQRDAEQAKRQPPEVARRSWAPKALLGFGPLFVILTAWNIARLANEPVVFSTDEEQADARFTIYLAAQEIDMYRDTAGAWPSNLELLGLDGDNLHYVQLDDGYRLTFELDNIYATYRSGEDLTSFAEGYLAFERGGQP